MKFPPPEEFPEYGKDFGLSSDPHAVYRVLDVRRRSDGLIEVDSVRRGPSGIDYSERLIDPVAQTFAYMRHAETHAEFVDKDRTLLGDMAEFVDGSISDLICRHVLKLVRN
jgi:hypothetical protein